MANHTRYKHNDEQMGHGSQCSSAYLTIFTISPHPNTTRTRERTFNFDHSFWSHSSGEERGGNDVAGGGSSYSSQADVHRALGEFLVDNACQGFNCSLFAYGENHDVSMS